MAAQLNHEAPFQLESMARAKPPEGSEGTWYRYVIAQGTNRITGIRSGTESEVSSLLGEMIERLNERRVGKTRPRSG